MKCSWYFVGLVNLFSERGEEWERIWQPNIWLHWEMHHCSRKINLSLGNTFIKDSLKHGTNENEHSCWLHFFPPPMYSSNLSCISTLKAMRHTSWRTVRILSGRTTSCPVILQALVRHPLNLPPTSLRISPTVLWSSMLPSHCPQPVMPRARCKTSSFLLLPHSPMFSASSLDQNLYFCLGADTKSLKNSILYQWLWGIPWGISEVNPEEIIFTRGW